MEEKIRQIVDVLHRSRFDLSAEDGLKREMEQVFKKFDIKYEKERSLDPKNRLDFFVDGIAIEVKIKGKAKAIYRQCERYCGFDEVRSLILVTRKSMGFPADLNQKPCFYVSLGQGWL